MQHSGPRASVVGVTCVRGGREVDAHAVLLGEVRAQQGSDDLTLSHHCPQCGGSDHGRPVVRPGARPASVSLSRTVGLVAVATSADRGVGVDVELLSTRRFHGIEEVVCHPLETPDDAVELARLWVRKEAVLKATGLGLQVPLDQLAVLDGPSGASLVAWPGDTPPEVTILDFTVGATHVGAVALLGSAPVSLRVTERPGPDPQVALSRQAGRGARGPGARPRTDPRPPRDRVLALRRAARIPRS